jgi:hypothetical protein
VRLLVVVLLAVLLVAVAQAGGFPGQQDPGPRQPNDPDQLTWTTSQHLWYLVHQWSDALVPVLALAAAGAGGAWWSKRKARGG